MMRAQISLAVALLASSSAGAAGLQHDVFERPQTLKPAAGGTVKAVTPPPQSVEWRPELRAIIAGAGGGMVNVEGRILQIGQEMDGYRLTEVQDRKATFVKAGSRHTLALKAITAGETRPVAAEAAQFPAAVSHSALEEPRGLGSLKTSDVLSKPPAQENVAHGGRPR